jgi:hypothetical protein
MLMRRTGWAGLAALLVWAATVSALAAAEPPLAAVTLIGPAETVFSAKRDACDGDDVPDAPARAFRDAKGHVVMFGLHTKNRALRGPDFARLKIDCTPAMPSRGNENPAAYDDASWIAATWTEDGKRVQALVHHEYQANTHSGRCSRKEYLACWYNTVVGVSSADGARSFDRPEPPEVIAAAPFRQDVGQGRHRGFFNPSNIFGQDRFRYFLSSTTGWAGQDGGACLFRTNDPADPSSWRAYDGKEFSARFGDPYRNGAGTKTCKTIWPFPAPVGSVVRHRPTGAWIAVFQASANADTFPEAGFYTTSSRDLLTWDKPRLLLAGKTLYDDPCGSGGRLISYPSLIDAGAEGRNFDDVGATADLYYATLRVEGCQITSDRDLLRRLVAIQVWP